MSSGLFIYIIFQSASLVNDIYGAYKEDLTEFGNLLVEDTNELLNQVVPSDPTGVTGVLTESLTEGTLCNIPSHF